MAFCRTPSSFGLRGKIGPKFPLVSAVQDDAVVAHGGRVVRLVLK
jgi:hypothetical protein